MFRAKRVPQLRFFIDDTFERLERLEEIFERIEDD
jgi:ribosome-binding factor A